MTDIRLITFNARGLRETLKRRALFRHVHAMYPGYIVCLQETHSVDGDEKIWRAEWGSDLILSHGRSANQGGVAVMLPSGYGGKVKLASIQRSDRIIVFELEWSDEQYFIVSVYAPNSNQPREQAKFIDELEERLRDLPEMSRVFLCGDFNMHLSPLDTSADFVNSPPAAQLTQMLDRFGLVDVWRYTYPGLSGFTWRRGGTALDQQSRIDFFFISSSTLRSQGISKIEIRPGHKSDHNMLVLEMNIQNQQRGPGVWRFNNNLLANEEFLCKAVEEIGRAKKGEGIYANIQDTGLIIEILLAELRAASITIGKRIAKNKCREEKQLLADIVRVIIKMQQGCDYQSEYANYKARWETLQEEKAKKAMLFSQARWCELGEKPTGYFLKMQKRNREIKVISKLIDSSGTEINDRRNILRECTEYYRELYTSKKSQLQSRGDFAQFFEDLHNPRLTMAESASCDGDITNDECLTALKVMACGKVPGPSGFTKEFFLTFWDHIGSLIVTYINQARQKGLLFVTQRRGFITLLPKKGDQRYLKNKRPIVLLDVIYKIVAKVIALRLGRVVSRLVSADQTGFLKGRYIGDNLRLMSDILHYTKSENIPGVIMNLDYEYAFDSVEHGFLFRALRVYNFGESLISWVQLLYNSSELTVLNNGYTGDWFQPSRAVKQGCPVSGMIFVLAVELFACKLRSNESIRGIRIKGKELKISQYADDTVVFVDGKESATSVMKLINEYGDISGLNLNQQKCDFVWIGKNID